MSSLLQTYLRFRPAFFRSFSPFIQRVNAKNSSNKLNRGKITRVSRTSARKKNLFNFCTQQIEPQIIAFSPLWKTTKTKRGRRKRKRESETANRTYRNTCKAWGTAPAPYQTLFIPHKGGKNNDGEKCCFSCAAVAAGFEELMYWPRAIIWERKKERTFSPASIAFLSWF